MKKSKSSEEQIVRIIKEIEAWTKAGGSDACRSGEAIFFPAANGPCR